MNEMSVTILYYTDNTNADNTLSVALLQREDVSIL